MANEYKKESKQFRPVGSLSGLALVLFFCFQGTFPSRDFSLSPPPFFSFPYTSSIPFLYKLSISIFHLCGLFLTISSVHFVSIFSGFLEELEAT